MKLATIASLALILVGLPAIPVRVSAQDDFTIRARVDVVVVPFSVMDGDRFVPNLTPKDFTVLEDGVPQEIEEFSTDPVPLSAVILIDTGVDPDSLEAFKASRESLTKAFNLTPQHRQLGIADEVAVYRYNNFVTPIIEFTDDEDVLRTSLQSIDSLRGGSGIVGGQSPVDAPVINGIPTVPAAPRPVTADPRVLHDAVNEATLALRTRAAERRKIILLFSDGSQKDSEISYEDVQLRLLEAEVQVFAVHIRNGLFDRVLGNLTSSLDEYADFTGGEVYATTPSDLDPLFPRITGQARSQYVLTYRSSNRAPQDRLVFRRIDIRTGGGYRVFHRAGYYQAP